MKKTLNTQIKAFFFSFHYPVILFYYYCCRLFTYSEIIMVDHKMQNTNRKDAVVVPVNEEVVSRSLEIKLAGGTSMNRVRKTIK